MSNKKTYNTLTVIIPALNVETTLVDTLKSILEQDLSFLSGLEILVINDGSKDKTHEVADEYLKTTKVDYQIIDNPTNKGIANAYNTGMKISKYEIVALIQADIVFETKDCLKEMFNNLNIKDLIGTYPYVLHPFEIWKTYNLWQKAMFDRLVGKRCPGNFTKCVVGIKEYFQKAGGYDETINSGEDREMYENMKVLGKIEITDQNVIHVHSNEANFPIIKLYRKEAQESEGAGVMLRRYGFSDGLVPVFFIFARPIMFLTLFVPFLWPFTAIFIYLYTQNIYKHERNDKEIWKVPFVTIARMGIYSYYLMRGLIKGTTGLHTGNKK